MSVNELIKRGWYRAVDDKGGQGDDLPLDEEAVDDDKTDDTADDKTEDTSDASDSRDDDKTDDTEEDKPDPNKTRLEELEAEKTRLENELKALKEGGKKDEPAAEPEKRLNPYQQAKKEIEAQGLDPELWPEKVREREAEIREERDEENRLNLERPKFVQMHTEMFTKEGEEPEVASQMAADMTAIRLAYGRSAFEETPLGKDQTRDSLVYAHGLQRLREIAAKQKSGGKEKAKAEIDPDAKGQDADKFQPPVNNGVAPTNGNALQKAMKDKESAEFLKEFQERHGRKPTQKELNRFVERGLVKI